MTIVDIITLVLIGIGALVGFKKGVIRTFVQLIGIVSISIVAFQFKGVLGNVLIRNLPFFNFGGAVNELYSLNLLFYQGVAFVVIWVLMYCLLNILIDLSGIIDMLLKLTIVLAIPSKIMGAIIGAVEMIIFIFILGFSMLQFNHTQKFVMDSKVLRPIVERTPVVNAIFAPAIAASENIYDAVVKYKDTQNSLESNLEIIRALIKYQVVSDDIVQECIDNGKLRMENVVVAS